MTNTIEKPVLKPGDQSSEFTGKIALQAIALLLTLVNAVLEAMGHEPIILDPELSLAFAGLLEAAWMTYRQWNKSGEIRAQADYAMSMAKLERVRTGLTTSTVVDQLGDDSE